MEKNMMVSMHSWMLWRFLVIALMVLPFIVAAVVRRFRERQADGSIRPTQRDERNASLPTAGPDAWRTERVADVQAGSVDNTVAVERRAA
jgi:hypothetical protein